MVTLNINFSNKTFYLLIGILALIAVAGVAIAYGGTEPAVHGHDIGEIESCKIVSGAVNKDGTIRFGTGFTSTKIAKGQYEVTFDSPFSSTPSAVISLLDEGATGEKIDDLQKTGFKPIFHRVDVGYMNRAFSFIAIGECPE